MEIHAESVDGEVPDSHRAARSRLAPLDLRPHDVHAEGPHERGRPYLPDQHGRHKGPIGRVLQTRLARQAARQRVVRL
jgi:hypothetical protein